MSLPPSLPVAFSAPSCPYCRQRMTLLIPFFSEAERNSAEPSHQREIDELLEKVRTFNVRYSSEQDTRKCLACVKH